MAHRQRREPPCTEENASGNSHGLLGRWMFVVDRKGSLRKQGAIMILEFLLGVSIGFAVVWLVTQRQAPQIEPEQRPFRKIVTATAAGPIAKGQVVCLDDNGMVRAANGGYEEEIKWQADKIKDLMGTESALRSTNEYLHSEFRETLTCLRNLYDHQNGCPLPKYETEWNAAMAQAERLLQQHEGTT